MPLQFKEAIDWLKSLVPLTESQWVLLQKSAQKKSFTVASLAQQALVAQVQSALVSAIETGSTVEDFAAAVGASLEASWVGTEISAGARIETIFRTNLMSAYNAGRYAQATSEDTLETRPYWRYLATVDSRTAPQCKAANGVILPATDPYWQSHFPPLHHRCRCIVQTLTEKQALRLGGPTAPSEIPAAPGFGAPPEI